MLYLLQPFRDQWLQPISVKDQVQLNLINQRISVEIPMGCCLGKAEEDEKEEKSSNKKGKKEKLEKVKSEPEIDWMEEALKASLTGTTSLHSMGSIKRMQVG